MPDHETQIMVDPRSRAIPPLDRRTLPRLALIAGVVGVLSLGFAAAAGWLSPQRLTPARVMTVFYDTSGYHAGFRRNHARGVCATGWFEPSAAARTLSHADVFRLTRTPVVARFSLAGGAPFQPDTPKDVRSLALRLMPPDAAEWRTGMIVLPIFPAANAKEFAALTKATAPPPGGAPDPGRVQAFLAGHPTVAAALGYIKAHPPGTATFADGTYHGLDAFIMTNAKGVSVPVRWTFRADPANATTGAPATGPVFLFEDLLTALRAHPLHWHMMVAVADPTDQTADPSRAWPDDRRQVDAGVLTINAAQSEDGGPCTGITFDPLILPPGIAASDDPIPSARSASYARSFALRSGEAKPPSAVTPAIVAAATGPSGADADIGATTLSPAP